MRIWDSRTANGVDVFIANSRFIAKRIRKVYRRKSTVIHPPVDIETISLEQVKEDFYLTASRMVPYKRVDLIIEAFTKMPNKKLIVIGDGECLTRCKKLAGPNIRFLGYQPQQELRRYMRKAKAFVVAAQEDFGITAVEAQACGTPVICLDRGGSLDSVIGGRTGVFFHQQNATGIIEAVEQFDATRSSYAPIAIRRNAERFSEAEFRRKFAEILSEQWSIHNRNRAASAPEGGVEMAAKAASVT